MTSTELNAKTPRRKEYITYFSFSLIVSAILFLLMACGPHAHHEEEDQVQAPVVEAPSTLIGQAVEAHGGIATWQSYQTLEFDVISERGENKSEAHSILNLHSRHERITFSNYELGYDGQTYWQLLKEEGMKEKNPTFYINLQFYFFGMPFVLADPGTVEQNMGIKELDGKPYEVVKVGFESGTGVAPEDQYIVYLDPETKRMELLLYSVTYFNKENAEKYGALRYVEWQEVGGLQVPLLTTRHAWDAETESLGEENGTKRFENVRFSEEASDPSVFAKPEGAM